MQYTSVNLRDSIHIESLVTVHYFEYMSTFTFDGETHDFWEFLYVDKGTVGVTAGSVQYTLQKGDIIFHCPEEFHAVKANGTCAPNLVVVSFHASGPLMSFFENKLLQVDELERSILAEIIVEARSCFSSRLDDPYLSQLQKRDPDVPGAEQMLRLYLEQFLIHIMRRYSAPAAIPGKITVQPPKMTKSHNDNEIFNRVSEYLEKNLDSHVTIDQICHDNLVGRSQLQKIFKEKCKTGVIEYFSKMKITAAKQMIRNNHMNFTQISEQLGYTSIHYFSRQFKKVTGMTPSEYASSIKAMSERKPG